MPKLLICKAGNSSTPINSFVLDESSDGDTRPDPPVQKYVSDIIRGSNSSFVDVRKKAGEVRLRVDNIAWLTADSSDELPREGPSKFIHLIGMRWKVSIRGRNS